MRGPYDPSLVLLGEGWFPDSPGGAARVVRELHQALRPLVDVRTVVVGPVTRPVDGVRAAGTADEPLLRRLRAIARAAAEEARSADVVEAHFALYAWLPLLTRRFRGNVFIAHFHGPWSDEGRAAGDGPLRTGAKRAVERAVYRRASRLVAHSHAFRDVLVERFGVAPWDVDVVPPGVDLERFTRGDAEAARAQLGISPSSRVVASVRRLVPRMGLDVLLDACAQLEPDRRAELVVLIGGDGPERARLERRADALGLGDRVRFLGRVSERSLPDVYRAADVCVVPSTALEGFGLVVLEALACGTPVIATDVGGLPEALDGLDPSLIVPPADPLRLARRLEAALARPQTLPAPDRCRRHAERFSWAASAAHHLDVYRRAHRGAPRPPRVVFLDHCALLSGGELALLRLLQALGDAVSAHVILGEGGPLVDKLRAAGVSTEVLPLPRSVHDTTRERVGFSSLPGLETAAAAAYAVRLARRLRRLRPDLVHANSLKALLYGGVAGRLAQVPVVWHVRDRIAPDYLPTRGVRLVGTLARALPSAVIANSHETLARLHAASGGRTRRLPHAVVYDPLDRRPVPGRERGGPLRVGMLGRIAPWKGQDIFLDAFARAFERGEERARIVGAPLFGEERYHESLHRLVDELGLQARVEFAGFREDVYAELAQLDVLVHASRLPEPLGQVVQEGMRAGVPVVAAAAGGPAELIADGRSGFLFPPGDVQALAARLASLAADPDLRARVAAGAVARAEDFEPERIAPQVLDLYRVVQAR